MAQISNEKVILRMDNCLVELVDDVSSKGSSYTYARITLVSKKGTKHVIKSFDNRVVSDLCLIGIKNL